MSSARQTTENALFQRIEDKAFDATAEELVQLGQAFSHIVHGPQGGNANETCRSQATSVSVHRTHGTSQTDQHYTEHPSDEPRRSVGFSTTEEQA